MGSHLRNAMKRFSFISLVHVTALLIIYSLYMVPVMCSCKMESNYFEYLEIQLYSLMSPNLLQENYSVIQTCFYKTYIIYLISLQALLNSSCKKENIIWHYFSVNHQKVILY